MQFLRFVPLMTAALFIAGTANAKGKTVVVRPEAEILRKITSVADEKKDVLFAEGDAEPAHQDNHEEPAPPITETVVVKPKIESHDVAPETAVPAKKEEKVHPILANTTAVAAETSLKWLKNGNTRYTKRTFRADGRLPADRERTKTAQHPHAIVLSCADSRVTPEIVFDQGIGEVFDVRVAGEALDSSVVASIEYAVEHLGPKLIVVMGHTQCGAVGAALKFKEGESAGSESLDKLLAEIRPHLKTLTTEKPSNNLEVESALNADGVARDLVKRSEIIRKKVESGELTIKTALYWLDSGLVKFY
ncbi:MAG TPA: carbonic anhydrase [Bdellovibrionales bacterium]|nr:carbonic anhydrase [Bdellovibrionales bacterium]